MSDEGEEIVPEKPFHVDRAKTGRAACKKCKQKIGASELRLAKSGYNPFGTGVMKMWHHPQCLIEVFKKQRAKTKKIETSEDIGGWESIDPNDKEDIKNLLFYLSTEQLKNFECVSSSPQKDKKTDAVKENNGVHRDDTFREFRRLCVQLSNESSYLGKTGFVEKLFKEGSDGTGFKGNVEQWCRLLLPQAVKRVYNLQSKQLVKIFSRIFSADQDDMLESLEEGDVAETIGKFFESSSKITPCKKATLTMQQVDDFLEYLSKLTREEDQIQHFTKITKLSTTNDLKFIIRLIKHDLRINAGPKHILEGLHPDAYEVFQSSKDIKHVVAEALSNTKHSKVNKMVKGLRIMTPVLPMLAQACKSVDMAFKKCPNGMFSEIKYDGERVQLHKQGDTFKYFSRSLKPVLPHKVEHFKEYIPKAFPHGQDLILDAEVLMVDTNTSQPLPFGSLGAHKKNEFKDANVCLFIFDCIYFNGESLVQKPIKERRKIMHKNMTEIKNHIMFSEMKEIHKRDDLEEMITKVFKLGLEGLVLKDTMSPYEPGKRHWLKLKKDYLFEGKMADTADLVVLGAWFGTGKKGGKMSSFLMGCYNNKSSKWVTVTKVSGGHNDATLDKLQDELQVVKISKDSSRVPKWLNCTKTMVPDFVAKDPKEMPVWEITGAEFTKNTTHTANGISIRFPRVTRIRNDKDWKTATNLEELKTLFERSKDTSGFSLEGNKRKVDDASDEEKVVKKKKEADISENRVGGGESDVETEVDEEDEKEEKILKIKNPLPNIFKGLVLEISDTIKDYSLLRRYLIAYGAVIYNKTTDLIVENSNEQVTHVIYRSKKSKLKEVRSRWSKNVKHVNTSWLWDSIKLLEKQDEERYYVV